MTEDQDLGCGVGRSSCSRVGVRGVGAAQGAEFTCMVVMCRTVEVPVGVGVFVVTTCNPFFKEKRCFHTWGRGLFSFRLDQPFGAAGVGPWGFLEVVGSKSSCAAAPAPCVWHHSRNQIKACQRKKKKN